MPQNQQENATSTTESASESASTSTASTSQQSRQWSSEANLSSSTAETRSSISEYLRGLLNDLCRPCQTYNEDDIIDEEDSDF